MADLRYSLDIQAAVLDTAVDGVPREQIDLSEVYSLVQLLELMGYVAEE